MFSIATDPARKLIRAYLAGFLSVEEARDFVRQEQAAAMAMGVRSGEFGLLIVSDCMIQSQEVVAAFQGALIAAPIRARRVAIVRAEPLTRIQTQRILRVREDTAIFATVEEAEAFLFAPEGSKAAPAPGGYQLRSARSATA